MKLLFDQNLSHRLTTMLVAEFPGSQHVRDAGLAAARDPAVWAHAAAEGLVIVSKDNDFQQCSSAVGSSTQGGVGAAGELPDGCGRALLRTRQADLLAFE